MTIDKMAQKFTDLVELQKYCDSQYQLIIDLSKKITNLENERDKLQRQLNEQIRPISTISPEEANLSDQEAICKQQLRLLRDMSADRDLTLEETKRVEIYTKLLTSLTVKEADKGPKATDLKSADLLSFLNTDEQSK